MRPLCFYARCARSGGNSLPARNIGFASCIARSCSSCVRDPRVNTPADSPPFPVPSSLLPPLLVLRMFHHLFMSKSKDERTRGEGLLMLYSHPSPSFRMLLLILRANRERGSCGRNLIVSSGYLLVRAVSSRIGLQSVSIFSTSYFVSPRFSTGALSIPCNAIPNWCLNKSSDTLIPLLF